MTNAAHVGVREVAPCAHANRKGSSDTKAFVYALLLASIAACFSWPGRGRFARVRVAPLRRRGKIYFWDHEDELDENGCSRQDYGNVYLVANSLDEFLNNLYESEDE